MRGSEVATDVPRRPLEKLRAGLDEQTPYKILRGNGIKMLDLDRV
jgi:hypothetical protein